MNTDSNIAFAATDLLHELKKADEIIHNALQLMTSEQKAEWARQNGLDRAAGEGVTRRQERQAVISQAEGKSS